MSGLADLDMHIKGTKFEVVLTEDRNIKNNYNGKQ